VPISNNKIKAGKPHVHFNADTLWHIYFLYQQLLRDR